MRNTPKWLVLLLAVVLLVNALGITAATAKDASPIALHADASGSTVAVRILATEAQTVADGKLVVTYDAGTMTYTDTQTGAAWGDDSVVLSVNPDAGKVILAFANAAAANEGELFTLTFRSSADAVVAIDGSSRITGVKADLAQQISTCPSAPFVDMQKMRPEIHSAVDYMVGNDYMNGMSDTTFGPNVELNRAMMVTILYRIAGKPAVSGSHTFEDVPANKFYTDPVIWAVNNGITTGRDTTHFAPNASLTRQELVTFLYRFADVMGFDRSAEADLSVYTDADRVQPYAVDAFEWAVGAGVVKGTSDTTLHPENTTTRAQICIMITRLLQAQD